MKISVIIPTFHRRENLIGCLTALYNQTIEIDNFEVIVVNNSSEIIHLDPFSSQANFCLLNELKPGSYAARNTGIRNAKYSIIAFLDDDCIPAMNWVETIIWNFETNQMVERLAGKIELIKNINNPNDLIFSFENRFHFRNKQVVDSIKSCVTANCAMKSELFKKVGFFNETVFSGADIEWGLRASSIEISINYVDDLLVYHQSRDGIVHLIKKHKRIAGGRSNLNLSKFYTNSPGNKSKYLIKLASKSISLIFDKKVSTIFSIRLGVLFLFIFLLFVRAFERFLLLLKLKQHERE